MKTGQRVQSAVSLSLVGNQDVRLLAFQCKGIGLPTPEFEVRFHPTRRWRADMLFRDARLIVECDGGLYVRGRHSRGAGMEQDMVKVAEAMLLGYRVLRVSPRHIQQGTALQWIARLLREL